MYGVKLVILVGIKGGFRLPVPPEELRTFMDVTFVVNTYLAYLLREELVVVLELCSNMLVRRW